MGGQHMTEKVQSSVFSTMISALLEHGHSLDELADKLGVTPKTVYRWRTGQSRIPKLAHACVEDLLVDTLTRKE